jgi:hypothetical protein
MINSKDISIRQANDKDKDSIINLLNEVFIDQQRSDILRDNYYFEWKFKNSPFGDSILTVSEFKGEIIGFDHLWPWKLDYMNNTVLAYEACDSAVNKNFRGNRLLQRMRSYGIEQAKKNNASLMFNFPNNQSLKTNINYGYQYLGKISWWVKILKPFEVASLFFNSKSNKNSFTDELEYEELDLKILDEVSTKYPLKSHITIHRDFDYFNYRYAQHPTRRYGMLSFDNRVSAIYTINNNKGFREMVVTDVLGDIQLVKRLLNSIVKVAKKNSCAFIAIMNDNYMLNKLWGKGFVKKKEKNFTVYPINDSYYNIITHISSWNMSASMHDSI